MKTSLIVAALALAATAVVSNADATQTNGSGANFQPYNAAEATVVDYVLTGVRTLSPNPTAVFASIDHNPSNTGHAIYIDGEHVGAQTTTCTVYSHHFNGLLLAAHTVTASNVSGAWELATAILAAETAPWAYYSVLCLIPANRNGILYGVTVNP
jgi:hypothetical protein